jgi:PhnB protein
VEEADMTRGVTAGYQSVSPWVISRDTARLIEFAKAAFGAKEIGRVQGEDGTIGHAEFRIGDSVVLAFDARPHWPDTPAFLRLYVEDGDAAHRAAVAAGAESVTEMTEMFWGDRVGRVRDPLGNLWWIQSQVAELTPEEVERRAGEPRFLEAMRYVQRAEPFPGRG